MVLGAASEGYYGGEARFCSTADDARDYLLEHSRAGDVILFKASRAAGLETLAEQVIADHGGPVGQSAGDPT